MLAEVVKLNAEGLFEPAEPAADIVAEDVSEPDTRTRPRRIADITSFDDLAELARKVLQVESLEELRLGGRP